MRPGRLHAIVGPVFSGKTLGLVDEIRRATDNRTPYHVYKVSVEGAEITEVTAHTEVGVEAVGVDPELKGVRAYPGLIAIDDAHQLAPVAVRRVRALLSCGIDVVVSGLDVDPHGNPAGVMPVLLALADKVTKKAAVCSECSLPATRSHWTGVHYEPRCARCFVPQEAGVS